MAIQINNAGNYDTFTEAVNAAANGDIISISGGEVITENNNGKEEISYHINGATFSHNFSDGAVGGGLAIVKDKNSQLPQNSVITNATFDGNTANNASGGAIYYNWQDGTIEISNSTFSNNFTNNNHGGAIYSYRGDVTISGSYFDHNYTYGTSKHGGALFFTQSTSVNHVSGSTFSGNTAMYGAAIYNNGGTLYLSDSLLIGNSATSTAAIMNRTGAVLHLSGVTFIDNTGANKTDSASSAMDNKADGTIYIDGLLTLNEEQNVTNAGEIIVSGEKFISGSELQLVKAIDAVSTQWLTGSGTLTASEGYTLFWDKMNNTDVYVTNADVAADYLVSADGTATTTTVDGKTYIALNAASKLSVAFATNNTVIVDGITVTEQITLTGDYELIGINGAKVTTTATGESAMNFSGDGTIKGMTFTGCRNEMDGEATDDRGGALRLNSGVTNIIASVFDSNFTGGASGFGGAIATAGGTLNISGSTFISNTTRDGHGGAIYSSSTKLNITDTVFDGNKYPGSGNMHGGALYLNNSITTIDGCTFANSIASTGGAIFLNSGGTLTISNTLFYNNDARGNNGGEAIRNHTNAEMHLSGVTFTGTNSTSNAILLSYGGAKLYIDGLVILNEGQDIASMGTVTVNGSKFYTGDALQIHTAIQAADADWLGDYGTNTPGTLNAETGSFLYNQGNNLLVANTDTVVSDSITARDETASAYTTLEAALEAGKSEILLADTAAFTDLTFANDVKVVAGNGASVTGNVQVTAGAVTLEKFTFNNAAVAVADAASLTVNGALLGFTNESATAWSGVTFTGSNTINFNGSAAVDFSNSTFADDANITVNVNNSWFNSTSYTVATGLTPANLTVKVDGVEYALNEIFTYGGKDYLFNYADGKLNLEPDKFDTVYVVEEGTASVTVNGQEIAVAGKPNTFTSITAANDRVAADGTLVYNNEFYSAAQYATNVNCATVLIAGGTCNDYGQSVTFYGGINNGVSELILDGLLHDGGDKVNISAHADATDFTATFRNYVSYDRDVDGDDEDTAKDKKQRGLTYLHRGNLSGKATYNIIDSEINASLYLIASGSAGELEYNFVRSVFGGMNISADSTANITTCAGDMTVSFTDCTAGNIAFGGTSYAQTFGGDYILNITESTIGNVTLGGKVSTLGGDVFVTLNGATINALSPAANITDDNEITVNVSANETETLVKGSVTGIDYLNIAAGAKLTFKNAVNLSSTHVTVNGSVYSGEAVKIAAGVSKIGDFTITNKANPYLTLEVVDGNLMLKEIAGETITGTSHTGDGLTNMDSGEVGTLFATKGNESEIATKISGGKVESNLVAGAYVSAGNTAVVDKVELLIGGTAEVAAKVYAGGYLYGNGTDSAEAQLTVGEVNINIDGGAVSTNMFGGAHARQNGNASVTEVNITVTDGSHGRIYAGGWAEKGAVSSVGISNVIISGGTVDYLYGAGANADGETYVTTTNITIENDAVVNTIFMGGRYGYSWVENVNLTFAGENKELTRLSGVSSAGMDYANATVVELATDVTADLIDYVDKFIINENCTLTAVDEFYLGNRVEGGAEPGVTTFDFIADGEANWTAVAGISDFTNALFSVNGGEAKLWDGASALAIDGYELTYDAKDKTIKLAQITA